MPPKPIFFPAPADFRAWLEAHHDKLSEQFVGFHKKDSGKPSITWPESVEVALCFGWIDGVRKSIDETSYMIRFTPRKLTSTWSAINIKLVGELTKKGLMHPAGLKAFAARGRKSPEFTPTSNGSTLASRRSKRKNFVQTKLPGNSSVPERLGTKGCVLGGSSAQSGRRQS